MFQEDLWHAHSGMRTAEILARHLGAKGLTPNRVLNAGSGIYALTVGDGFVVSADLFSSPISGHRDAVCATVEKLPFAAEMFDAVVCVGEVLGYCDPALAVSEFSRVLAPNGLLILDFGSSRSYRYLFSASFGRAADLVVDSYNQTPEHIWIYNPTYIKSLLNSLGFTIRRELGTHSWSSLARRLGFGVSTALMFQRHLSWLARPAFGADVMTYVAERSKAWK